MPVPSNRSVNANLSDAVDVIQNYRAYLVKLRTALADGPVSSNQLLQARRDGLRIKKTLGRFLTHSKLRQAGKDNFDDVDLEIDVEFATFITQVDALDVAVSAFLGADENGRVTQYMQLSATGENIRRTTIAGTADVRTAMTNVINTVSA